MKPTGQQMHASSSIRIPSWMQGPWTIALLALVLHANTAWNGTALDDGLVLTENAYVRKGVAGIPEILSYDSFHGAVGNSAYLSGGRYRPLSLITYALEVSIFGILPAVHHLVNVLLLALTAVMLFRFLDRWVFAGTPWATWCTTMLFTMHPVHVEAVANIKGRDELLSLLFMLLAMHHALVHAGWCLGRDASAGGSRPRHPGRPSSGPRMAGRWSPAWMSLCFLLALLSKENGVILIVLLPITLHALGGLSPAQATLRSWPVMVLTLFYVGLRVALLGSRNNVVDEIMDNPYLYADTGQKLATILHVHLRYLGLLLWPDPLSYDYSFNSIPYKRFTDPGVIFSLIVHAAAVAFAFAGTLKRDLLAWCILFYLGTLMLVNNLFFNVGAPMGERFLYQASVPFLIALVEVLRRLTTMRRLAAYQGRIAVALVLVILPFAAIQVIGRNTHWRSGDDLFLHDVNVVPGSVRAQTFAGIALIHLSDSAATREEKRELAWRAVTHFQRADSVHDTYLPTLLNMGLAYLRLDSMERAEACWDRARLKDPRDPKLLQLEAYLFDRYYRSGVAAGMRGDMVEAMADMEHALRYGPDEANAWYDLGGICYTAGDFACARKAWERTLRLAPQHAQALQGMAALDMKQPPATEP